MAIVISDRRDSHSLFSAWDNDQLVGIGYCTADNVLAKLESSNSESGGGIAE
jgi:hypothetical protein